MKYVNMLATKSKYFDINVLKQTCKDDDKIILAANEIGTNQIITFYSI